MSTEYVSEEEIKKLIQEADGVLDELNNEIKHVTVKIPAKASDVIIAIKQIFGDSYINSDGSSQITYTMYSRVIDILKQAGELKVQEYL